jgi:hypothetical protein
MMSLGKEVADGFAKGIDDNAYKVAAAANRMSTVAALSASVPVTSVSQLSSGSIVNNFGAFSPTTVLNQDSGLEAYRKELHRLVDRRVDDLRRNSSSYTPSSGGVV